MSILFVMIPLSLALVVFAGWGFFWAVGSGQFDDLDSPSWEVLHDGVSSHDESAAHAEASTPATASDESRLP